MSIRIITGDCREKLAELPAESVHCVVTSPPYWGLRDYGAKGQIGLEANYVEYVDELVGAFRSVRRVLRTDGTVWLNLGDSYAGHNLPGWRPGNEVKNGGASNKNGVGYVAGCKPKDLVGIPWLTALALRADGWYLRQDIIWSKPNPMPESVTDRCTKAHEYIFLLSKSERYYYDAAAIAEPSIYAGVVKNGLGTSKDFDPEKQRTLLRGTRTVTDTRNKRSVWEISTKPYADAHFATFPPALIEPCILAGCPKQCCAKCGAPWVKEVEREPKPQVRSSADVYTGRAYNSPQSAVWGLKKDLGGDPRAVLNEHYGPSCGCCAGTVLGTVLDPFGGAGTTGLVADGLGRNAILIELNPEYAAMAERRIDLPMFSIVAP